MPEPWPGSPKRLEMFVRWLARRYDRPALPDAMVEVFQKPIEHTFMHFAEEYPETMLAFSKIVHEIRINLPTTEDPPFDLQLTLLTSSDGLSGEQADAIDIIAKAIRASLDPKEVYLHPEVRILPSHNSVLYAKNAYLAIF